ncbi:response regulator [Azospirillum halopraeferens]|uniref:response regulator n=1 Tax=Azospirillum halopraeferens TaxID=34010 RepID=UPI000406AAEA|nr:response regulator [Azospirillum halopraeferens]
MTADERLSGLRVLLVEDEAMVAMMLEDMLGDLGCRIIGPAASVAAALELAADPALDGAILDVNVGGEPIYPVAEALTARGIPFVFTTGYGAADIDARFADAPALQKPFSPPSLYDALADAVAARRR